MGFQFALVAACDVYGDAENFLISESKKGLSSVPTILVETHRADGS